MYWVRNGPILGGTRRLPWFFFLHISEKRRKWYTNPLKKGGSMAKNVEAKGAKKATSAAKKEAKKEAKTAAKAKKWSAHLSPLPWLAELRGGGETSFRPSRSALVPLTQDDKYRHCGRAMPDPSLPR
jgi:hypothetical protein